MQFPEKMSPAARAKHISYSEAAIETIKADQSKKPARKAKALKELQDFIGGLKAGKELAELHSRRR